MADVVFRVALTAHVVAGLTSVISGALAAFAGKRPGRHPRAGTVFLWGLAFVVATATVMSALRWERNWHLFLIAVVAGGLGLVGWRVRRRRPPGWLRWHGIAMAGAYVALLTGFYVDNGERLPVWDRLPHLAYWLLPAVVGAPLTWWALRRNGALSRRPPSGRR